MLLLKLAFRNILRQKRRSVLTGLSMSGGFMLCTFSFALLDGSWGTVVDIFTLDHTGHIQIHKDDYHQKPKIHKTIDNPGQISDYLSEHPEVSGYAPRVFAPGLAYAGNRTSVASIIGVDPDLEPTTSRLREKVQEGSYFDSGLNEDGYAKAMVGAGVAHTLKIGLGDELIMISQGADGSIANDIFIVHAIIGNKTSFDRQGVYLPLSAAQVFLSMGNRVHEYALLVDDDNNNEEIARQIQTDLPELNVSPWQVVEATFYKTMQADKQGNHFTMGVIMFIVFIGVLNTVLMSVLERTREFGVLRAIGSRPFAVARLIFVETLMMSLICIVIGALMSLPLLYWAINYGFELPEPVDMGGVNFQYMRGRVTDFVLIAPSVLLLSFAALVSIPPAIRAARISPKEAMSSY